MAFTKKKVTRNIHRARKTNETRMAQSSANGLSVTGNLKANANGSNKAKFNLGKNTSSFKE